MRWSHIVRLECWLHTFLILPYIELELEESLLSDPALEGYHDCQGTTKYKIKENQIHHDLTPSLLERVVPELNQ